MCVCVCVRACACVCATHGGLSDTSALEIRSRGGSGFNSLPVRSPDFEKPGLYRYQHVEVDSSLFSLIHTARWSRKIARKLPECLLCERKHVPGLIPGLIPGWDLVTLPGSVPERALCEQKPDQCRKGCVVVMTHFIVRQFYRVF